jgi:hypothetical protein
MKNLMLLTFLLLSFSFVKGQVNITYSASRDFITTVSDTADVVEPYDSVTVDSIFKYHFTTVEVSEDGKDTTITTLSDRTKQEMLALLYRRARQQINTSARFQYRSIESLRSRNDYLRLLDDVGLNNYYADVRDQVRKNLKGDWIIVSNGTRYNCTIAQDNGACRINDADESGAPWGEILIRLVPRSDLYIDFVFTDSNYGDNGTAVTQDREFFVSPNTDVRMRFLNQNN